MRMAKVQFVAFDHGLKTKLNSLLDLDKHSGTIGAITIGLTVVLVTDIAAEYLSGNPSLEDVAKFLQQAGLKLNGGNIHASGNKHWF